MNGRWNHVVAGLSAIDVIVGVRAGEMRDHLVSIHVRRCAATGLENVDDKLSVVIAGCHGIGSLLDGCGKFGRQLAQPSVYSRGGAFNYAQRAQEGARKSQPADREILNRALRLRTVQRIGGDAHFAHGVPLDAVFHGGYGLAFGWPLVSNTCTVPYLSSTGLSFTASPTATICRSSGWMYLRATRCTCSAVIAMILAG